MPKGPALALVFEAISILGRLSEWVAMLTSLLVYLGLLLSKATPKKIRLVLVLFLAFQAVPIFFPKSFALLGLYHLSLGAAALVIVLSGVISVKRRIFLGLVTFALLAAGLSFSINLYIQGQLLPLSPRLAHLLFRSGEVLAVAAALWAPFAFGGKRLLSSPLILIPMSLAILFYLARERSPVSAYIGLLTVWSTGFTLFLPSWLYSLSLFSYFTALLTGFRARANTPGNLVTVGLIILLASRYSPQQISHGLLALLAITILWGKPSLGKTL